MKQLFLTLSLVLTAVSAFAQNNTVVRWNQIAGVITQAGLRWIATGTEPITVNAFGY